MDKVTCLKNLLSCFNEVPPDKIKGDTIVDVLEQFVDYYKNHGGAQVNSITGVKGNAESSYRTGNVNITPANIGASPSDHTHLYAGSSSAGGAANSAVKLQTPRTITLSGGLNGSVIFDGSADIKLNSSLKRCHIYNNGVTSAPWYKFA